MFGAKFPLQVKREKIVFASHATVTVPAGTTTYLYAKEASGEHAGGINPSETFATVNFLVTRSGFLRNLVVKANAAPGAGETFTYTVRVNGVPTALTTTISGAVQVDASDLVNVVLVDVGDRVTLQLVTSGAASARTHSAAFSLELNMVRQVYDHVSWGIGGSTAAAGLTRFLSSLFKYTGTGAVLIAETDNNSNYLVVRKGTIKNLVVLANGAPGAGESFVYTLRVNGAPTALTVTVSGAVNVTGMDTVNVVQVDPSNTVTLQIVTSGAAAAVGHLASVDFEEGDYRAG